MRFGLLGPLVATGDDGVAIDLGQPRQRAVLALLVLNLNMVVSAERLIDDMWGDEPPARPAGALHAYVSNLRRALEPQRLPRAPAAVLVSQSPGYVLRAEIDDVDSIRFERLASEGHRLVDVEPGAAVAVLDAALAEWRGAVLAEFAGEPWVASSAARLDEVRASVVEDRFTALLITGCHAQITADLRAAVERDPLRERLWELLIVALYRSGRQADALAAYNQVRHHLNDELGIDPGPALAALELQVLNHAPELDVSARLPVPPPQTSRRDVTPSRPEPADAVELFGREADLAAIRDVVADLRTSGSAIVVSGPAGVGKTRLVEVAFGAGAETTTRAVWGRCVDGDVAPPMWPWLQVASALGPEGAALQDALRASPARDGVDAAAARAEMYEATVAALIDVARAAPLAVVIDDAQWAGVGSHHILQLLMARLSDAPLLVVLTVRDGETGSELTATLSAVARTRPATRINLTGLGSAAIASYVEDRLGAPVSDDVVSLLAQRTGGNPFFLVELVRSAGAGSGLVDVDAFAETVPGTVRDVIDRRVAALPAQCGPILLAAAVAGRTFDWRVVAAAAQQPAAEALDALDAAVVSGLIEESTTPTRYRFVHDLIRECLYGELSVARRGRLHAAVAEKLHELHGDDHGHANEIAAHAWIGRGVMDASDVVARLLAAADVTAASLSHEATERHLRHALEIAGGLAPGEERERLERVATARLARLLPEVDVFSTEEAISLLSRARELLGRADDKAELPAILNELGVQAMQLGDWSRAVAIAEEIEAIGTAADDDATLCNARSLLALIALDRGQISTSVSLFDKAAEHVRRSGPQRLIQQFRSDVGPMILTMRGFALALAGDSSAAAARDEAVMLAEDVDLAGREFALVFAAWHAVAEDDASTTLNLVERCGAEAHMGRAAGRLDLVAGWALGRQGEVAAGLERLLRGHRTLAAVADVQHIVSAFALEADVLLRAGRASEAADCLDEGFAFNDHTGASLWLPELHRLRGDVILALGEPADGAVAAFATARSVALEQGAIAFVRRADASAERLSER